MRPDAARVAGALLALLFGAAGCKPDTLAPFWIGTKHEEISTINVNGVWNGTTANGGSVRFLVGDREVSDVTLFDVSAKCSHRFEINKDAIRIDAEEFSYEVGVDPQGRFVINGRFGSSTVCFGSYFYEGLASAEGCPTSGSGQFTAQKK